MQKFRVVIVLDISARTIENTDNGILDPKEYLRTELGWASDAFDGFDILEVREITSGAPALRLLDKDGRIPLTDEEIRMLDDKMFRDLLRTTEMRVNFVDRTISRCYKSLDNMGHSRRGTVVNYEVLKYLFDNFDIGAKCC